MVQNIMNVIDYKQLTSIRLHFSKDVLIFVNKFMNPGHPFPPQNAEMHLVKLIFTHHEVTLQKANRTSW